MSYTIIGSQRSPFVRLCRMFMIANGIPCDFRIINFVDDPKAAAELAKETPINKVPVLVDGGQKIYDSRIINRYLIEKHDLEPLTIDEENRLSEIYACMDSSVIMFLMRMDKFDIETTSGFFIKRQRERIPSNLDVLEPWVRTLDPKKDWRLPAMALFSYLYWDQMRVKLIDRAKYTGLVEFQERFAGAAGVADTGF